MTYYKILSKSSEGKKITEQNSYHENVHNSDRGFKEGHDTCTALNNNANYICRKELGP